MAKRSVLLKRRTHFLVVVASIQLLLTAGLVLRAQEPVRIGNAFSSVYVVQDMKCGRFWFATGPQFGYTRYLYHGGKTATTVTSNVVFRVTRGKDVSYYCNTPDPFSNGGIRPQGPGGAIPFVPYDNLYVSPGEDTIEVRWKKVGFTYDITMRFVVEQPRNEYDDGADILLEFDYKLSGYVPTGTDLGIFLMLDGDNGTITSSVPSDHSSVVTDSRYFSKFDPGKSYQRRYGEIPEYYMTGWFEYSRPPSEVFSIHRVTGTSLGGAPLTTPNTFGIGNWKDLRALSWGFNADISTKQIGDVATVMRWDSLGDLGLVRTAFGTTSRGGNNLHVCRSGDLFGAVRTQRVVQQEKLNGPYSPAQFDVELWVSNVNWQKEALEDITLITPIQSLPSGSGRLTLDPSTPATVSVFLKPHETKKVTWRVNVDPLSNDTLALLNIAPFDCAPLVNVKGAYVPPPPDSRPPVVQSSGSGRDPIPWWGFRTFDRHADFKYDSGLDRIEVLRNDANNFRLILSPDPFRRCDTSVTVAIRAEVVDTTRPGTILFRVYDCNGNTAEGTASYTPRPDLFKPEVSRVDSLNGFSEAGYPCAVQTYEVYLEDQNNQTADAGDAGFGTVEVLSSTNFDPIAINFDRGDVAIADFDRTASFRLQVSDRLFDADAVVRVADYAGNADTLNFHYCTIPDRHPPEVSSVAVAGDPVRSWRVDGSDTLEWDRGLAEIVEISNTNMSVSPWPVVVVPGQPEVKGVTVSVVDDAWDGELTLEYRDMSYDRSDPGTYANHSTRVQFRFSGIKDTLAPNIGYRRDLTVGPTAVVFTVLVNDTHYVDGNLYRYDRGLEDVRWTLTSNMRVRRPLVYGDNRRGGEFQVEIIDPSAVVSGDTVCVEAIDSAGNVSRLCQWWPSTPDGKSPLFDGSMDAGRTRITGVARDDRASDRGLGSVELRNGVNLKPYTLRNLQGAPSVDVELEVIDPQQPVSGELVIRDLIGDEEGGVEQTLHTVVIPFSLGVGSIGVELPELVEGGEDIDGVLRAGSRFVGGSSGIESMGFVVGYSGGGTYVGSTWGSNVGGFSVSPGVGGDLTVVVDLIEGKEYEEGEELGRLRFSTVGAKVVEKFNMALSGVVEVNGGSGRVIEVRTEGDPDASVLRLPPAYVRVESDSQTVVNGECNRVLESGSAMSRLAGLRILEVAPQPARAELGELSLVVSGMPADDVVLELVTLAGDVVSREEVSGGQGGSLQHLRCALPVGLAEGAYFLRVSGSTGGDQVKVLIRK